MKKNFFIIFLTVLLVVLAFKRFALPTGTILLIIGTASLVIGYLINGLITFKNQEYSNELKYLKIFSSFYLVLTLIGLIFRHQWWEFPYWLIIFRIVWPILTIGLLIRLFVYLKGQTKTENKIFKKNILFPLTIIIILAIPTFFTSTKTFCKIFKSYSSEQLYEKWQQETIK